MEISHTVNMKKILLTPVMLAIGATALAVTPFKLNHIEVNGVTKAQQQGILELIQLKSGKLVNDADIASIIKKLYSTGNFTNVAVNKVDDNLVVDLHLKEVIASLNFKGNSVLPTEQIRKTYEENNIRQGARLNSDVIDRLNQEVENFYKAQGYQQVAVNTQYQTLQDGTVNVTILVDEKKKSYLKALVLKGNQTFSESDILSDSVVRPDTHWYNFYHNSDFNAQGEQSLLQSITSFYKDRGYAKYKITSTKITANNVEKPQDVTFTVDMTEGAIYNIGTTSFFSRDTSLNIQLAEYNQTKSGQLYKQSTIDATVTGVKNYLATLGYAKASVVPVYRYNDDNHTVDIIFAVEKGQRFTVGSINFAGNYLTKDNVIRRQLSQQENSIYNLNKVNNDVTSLMRTGYFTTADYKTTPIPGTPDELNLTYNVVEASNGNFQIGLGYGDTQGLTFTTKFRQDNFLGTGRTFGIDLQKSKGQLSASLDYTEPYITTSGVSLSSSIYFTKADTSKFQTFNGYNYKKKVYGVSLGSTLPVSRFGTVNIGLAFEKNKYSNLFPEFYRGLYLNSIGQPTSSGVWDVKTHDLTLSLGYNYNTYNRYLFPTSGIDFTVAGGITAPLSTDKYLTARASFRGYYPINDANTWVLSGRLQGSHALAFSNKYLPISSLYTVGGFGTLRGFSYGSVGPAAINCSNDTSLGPCNTTNARAFNVLNPYQTIGGDSMIAGGVDLIFPLFRGEAARTVRTSFFIDAATAWSTKFNSYTKELRHDYPKMFDGYNFNRPDFRVSYGVALDWKSPLGLLSFSLGFPLVSKSYDTTEKFSINIGTSF